MKAIALLSTGLLIVAACGREEVVLALDPSPLDGGTISILGGDAGSASCSARSACRALDAPCGSPNECCSGRCDGGRCLPGGDCRPPSAVCANRSECCSGRCEPVAGTTNRACTNLCRAEGVACSIGADCCSFHCRSGVCAAGACGQTGDDCATASECCSGQCLDGRCRVDATALCRATGEDCTSGGGSPCCYGCFDGRCDLGPGPCRSRGAPCATTADCCTGACIEGEDKARFCVSACVEAGAACKESSDCCSGACTSGTGTCAASASTCSLVGESCTSGQTCCTGSCFEGRCADSCPAPVR